MTDRIRVIEATYLFNDWYESDHAVLWWLFPINEPPYVGTPLDDDWPFTEVDVPNLLWSRIPIPSQAYSLNELMTMGMDMNKKQWIRVNQ